MTDVLRRSAACAALAASAGAAFAAIDLAAVQVLPQRGQSSEQMRRDRYECHNWAVEQTGFVPRAPRRGEQDRSAERAKQAERAERAGRAIGGAAIGAAIGGLITSDSHHHGAEGPLLGAAVGAAVGAATTPRTGDAEPRHASSLTREESDYVRALSACMEGRGYKLVLPSEGGEDAA